MKLSLKAFAAAALLVAGLAVSSAEAAPAGAGLVPLGNVAETSTLAEKTRWVRRCHRTYYGVRCRRVWVKHHRHYRPYKHHRRHHHRHHRRYH